MSNLSKTTLAAGVGVGVVVLVGGGWFGLSAFASGKAEQELKAKLAQANLLPYVTWSAVSSSPLGGEISIRNLKINYTEQGWRGPTLYLMDAERVVLNGFNAPEKAARAAGIQLEKVSFPSMQRDQREQNQLRSAYQDSPIMMLAYNTGRQELPPFSVAMRWQLNEQLAGLTLSLDQPELLSLSGTTAFSGMFGPLLQQLQSDPENVVALSGILAQMAATTGLSQLDLELKDQGAVNRLLTLQARYAQANGQPNQSANELYALIKGECQSDLAAVFRNQDACDRLASFVSGKQKQLALKTVTNGSLTANDFMFGGLEQVKNRLQPELR